MSSPVHEGEILAGKYRVDRVLGVGGMGVVVAAHHVDLDEQVALKFLLPEMLGNAEAVARFAREARAAVRIKSEHVARVSDVGKLENGAPYMVMEYLDGTDLSGWMKREGVLPVDLAVEFLLQACEAITEAHVLGIVHRDLKPANLFVIRRPDGTLAVKVLDFGISKTTGRIGSQGDASMTKTSALLGSPLYMSPEQMQSSKDVDSRTDIWALGVMLYELITGDLPFGGENIPELVLSIMSSSPKPLRDLVPNAPDGLEEVIFKCLAKDRNQRWESVGALAKALLPFAPRRSRASVERISGVLRAAGYSTHSLPPASSADGDAHEGRTNATFVRTRGENGTSGKVAIAVGLAIVAIGVVVAVKKVSSAPPEAALLPSASPLATTAGPSLAGVAPAPASAAAVLTEEPHPANADSAAIAVQPVVKKEPAKACAPGTSRCSKGGVEKCLPEGTWSAPKGCANKSECRGGACVTTQTAKPVAVTRPAAAARPQVHAAAPKAPVAKPAAPAAKPKCDRNYFFDSDGNKHFRPECF